jgi:nitronate monooxygenase
VTGLLETAFTRLVGCTLPIQQAGMGLVAPALAAAVTAAGGLGMLSGVLKRADALAADLDRLASKPVGVNFLVPFLDETLEAVDVAAERARVVELFWGEPDAALVERIHAQGALVSWQVGSVREALAAEAAGCDLLVVQGVEAGGHVRGTIGILPLLAQTLDEVTLPVLAAGGIATGRGLAAVLAAGAAGARIGTRFVVAEEAGFHPRYVQALVAAEGEDTTYTDRFAAMWHGAPHRVLRSALERAEALDVDVVGTVEVDGEVVDVPRLAAPAPTASATGDIEAMALFAGQGVGAVRRSQPAAEIVAELAGEAERLLGRFA